MSLAIICIIMFVGSVEYHVIKESQISTPLVFALLPVAIILIISCIAELGRPPLDLLEAESELVSLSSVNYAKNWNNEISSAITIP